MNKIKLNKEEVFKLTHCPLCKGKLFPFNCIMTTPYTYCPKCNIAKMSFLTFPFLCSDCDSDKFIADDFFDVNTSKSKCFLCNGKMRGLGLNDFYKLEKEDKLRRGYYVSQYGLRKELLQNNYRCSHEITNLTRHNKSIFKGKCHCGFIVYTFIPEWQEKEMKKIDENTILLKK